MQYTEEQQAILDTIVQDSCDFIKVNSVAGSGKTTLLIGISKILKPKNGLYIAYNKAIADEAKTKFDKNVICQTTHSLAYQNTIKHFNLNVGVFNYKVIKERIKFELKLIIIDLVNDFFLSKYVKIDDYIKSNKEQFEKLEKANKNIVDLVPKYIRKMISGQIDITHAGYLKFYHILLANNKIKHDEFDVLMLDEAGDINPVTLEIFKLLPAKKKVMVGDENQNIYTFNKTINGFVEMKDVGIQMNMTQSFRCSPEIADRIDTFIKRYIDINMEFKGTRDETCDMSIKSSAIISRTNSGLIGEIIALAENDIKFSLTRKASQIFELVLILANLKPGGKIFSREWSFLQDEVDEWNMNPFLLSEYKSAFAYIADKYSEDIQIKTATKIIGKYGTRSVYSAYNAAKESEKRKTKGIVLCTAHSSKGLEFDKVKIADDLNNSLSKIFEERSIAEFTEKDIEEFRLYYVACSRAKKELINAEWL